MTTLQPMQEFIAATYARIAHALEPHSDNRPYIGMEQDARWLGEYAPQAFARGELDPVLYATIETELRHHSCTAMPFRQGCEMAMRPAQP